MEDAGDVREVSSYKDGSRDSLETMPLSFVHSALRGRPFRNINVTGMLMGHVVLLASLFEMHCSNVVMDETFR